jgi:hypothetical protein
MDLLSALQNFLSGYSPDHSHHSIAIETLFEDSYLRMAGKSVAFCLLLVLTGLAGNKAVSAVALHRPLASDRAVSSDVHAFLHHALISLWQD